MKHNPPNNKIFMALLFAGVIAFFCGFIARQLVVVQHLEKDAVSIEAAAGDSGGAAMAEAKVEPILGLLEKADPAQGAKIAKACAACHNFDKGGKNGVGPNLWGIVNNKKDHMPDFSYSGELVKVGGPTWTYEELNHFLWKPKGYAPGTKMTFMGLKKPEDRAAVIAWLRTLADSPAALPSKGDIDKEAAELAPPAPAEKAEEKAEDAPKH